MLPAAAVAGVALVGGGVVLDLLGVAGYRNGFLLTALLLGVAGGAAVWLALAGVPQRATWLVAYLLLAVVVAGVLVDRAPLSTGRLRAAADDIELPFHRVVGTESSGNSRCRPCPAVTRRYDGPDLNVEPALIEVAAAAAAAGYPLELTVEHRRAGRFATANGTIHLEVTVGRREGGTTLVLRLEGEGHRVRR